MDKIDVFFAVVGWIVMGLVLLVFVDMLGKTDDAVFSFVIVSGFIGAAWGIGAIHGTIQKGQARQLEKASKKRMKQSSIASKRAKDDIERAAHLEAVAKLKMSDEDDVAIRKIQKFSTIRKVEFGLRVGKFGNESDESYRERRRGIVELRTTQWGSAVRFGHRLQDVVARQNGLCGDPDRDPMQKGCGCYLYCFPPTAVHLDHIVPRASGGSNDLDNVQALCSACNISAGAASFPDPMP